MTQGKLVIAMVIFVALAILANWVWFPKYLLVGICAIAIIIIPVGFVVGLKNTIEDADKKASE